MQCKTVTIILRNFKIFLQKDRLSADPPVLFYLSGLTCTDENARTKSAFAREAAKYVQKELLTE